MKVAETVSMSTSSTWRIFGFKTQKASIWTKHETEARQTELIRSPNESHTQTGPRRCHSQILNESLNDLEPDSDLLNFYYVDENDQNTNNNLIILQFFNVKWRDIFIYIYTGLIFKIIKTKTGQHYKMLTIKLFSTYDDVTPVISYSTE